MLTKIQEMRSIRRADAMVSALLAVAIGVNLGAVAHADDGRAAPGAVDVDELAAQRALERTLAAEGTLLLPPWRYDIEPYLSFTRRESVSEALAIITFPEIDFSQIVVRGETVERNEFAAGFRMRFGLPLNSQIELDLPYRAVEESRTRPVGADLEQHINSGQALGDIKVGLATTLMRERRWRPDLIARLTWDSDTGKREAGGVGLGEGFNELRGELRALKRQDPLVFSLGTFFEHTFESDDLKPGQAWGLTLSMDLAASPETAMHFSLLQRFASKLEVDGERIDGTDETVSVLSLGASSILAPRVLLRGSVGIGLTSDAPDYSVNLSLPIRF